MHTTTLVRSNGRKPRHADPVLPAPLLGDSDVVNRSRAILELPGGGPLLILADEGLDGGAVGRYVHERTRAARPFVHIECADADHDALDRRLFGVRSRAAGELETL